MAAVVFAAFACLKAAVGAQGGVDIAVSKAMYTLEVAVRVLRTQNAPPVGFFRKPFSNST